MKKLWVLLISMMMINTLNAQNGVGDWEGKLEVQGMQLTILFHITQDGDKYVSTMDSPDQGANGIPMDKTTIKDSDLTIEAASMGMKFNATITEDGSEIVGTFNQGPMSLPLKLKRTSTEKVDVPRGDFNSPEILGDWNGVLDVQGTQLTVVFHLMEENGNLKGTMDSPDQGAKGIPMESATYENGVLTIKASSMRMEYSAKLNADQSKIEGTFTQGGMDIPLNLSKEKVEKKVLNRPQEPKDFPYQQEEVKFVNKKGGHHLAGTLTIPADGKFKQVAILVTGSGPQNRDEELLGHKPFLVISDRLTRLGIAVLRYDDRGVAESGGTFKGATTRDFADDVNAAVSFLKSRKDMKGKKIGIVGHSEGGMIAPIVASENKFVDYIVLLAGPGIDIVELMMLQTDKISESEGVSKKERARNGKSTRKAFDFLKRNSTADKAELKEGLTKILEEAFAEMTDEEKEKLGSKEAFFDGQMSMLLDDWFLYFMRFNPQDYLVQVKCPVMAVNGELDLQVTAKENLDGIKKGLEKANNKKVTIKEYKGLNHLFQKTETGAPSEYASLEETFSEEVMEDVGKWILGM